MKRIFAFATILLLLCTPGISLQAQSTATYGYDAAGNRVSRVIILNQLKKGQVEEKNVYSEVLKEMEVRIYPNPTEGLLRVELLHIDPEKQAKFSLYDLSGKLILEKNSTSGYTEIDISDRQEGTYILKIVAGESVTEWKIIKK